MRKVVFGRCVDLCVNLVQMRYSLFLFALIFVFCKNEAPDKQLFVRFSQISLLDAPGKKSKELRTLRQGESVTDLNETSHFESFLVFQDQNCQSPWIKVRASDPAKRPTNSAKGASEAAVTAAGSISTTAEQTKI